MNCLMRWLARDTHCIVRYQASTQHNNQTHYTNIIFTVRQLVGWFAAWLAVVGFTAVEREGRDTQTIVWSARCWPPARHSQWTDSPLCRINTNRIRYPAPPASKRRCKPHCVFINLKSRSFVRKCSYWNCRNKRQKYWCPIQLIFYYLICKQSLKGDLRRYSW